MSAPPPTAPSQPLFTLPNLISLARLATVPPFLWLFVSGRQNAAVFLFAIAGVSDFFDGYIARRTGQVTELGKLLDPLADRVFIVALAVALVVRGVLPVWLAAAVIARDVVILSLWPALERRRIERIPVNFTGKAATACLLFGLTWLAVTETSLELARFGDEVGLTFTVAGGILYWAAAALYARVVVRRLRALDVDGRK